MFTLGEIKIYKPNHLPTGYKTHGYKIIKVLGQGGFGITYLAENIYLKTYVVIKEFLPQEFASRALQTYNVTPNKNKPSKIYKYFKQKFLEEAQILASITHLNIVKVTHFFETNNTAYFVMDYLKGESLKSYITHKKNIDEEKIIQIIIPILEGLKEVHAKNFLHRDIAPDNIYLADNKMPILIDFGAVKNLANKESKSVASVAKKGYSAPEQYSSVETTPSMATDIYAVAAVMLTMITGEVPPEAINRHLALTHEEEDPIKVLINQHSDNYSQSFLDSILKAMQIKMKDRFQDVHTFQDALIVRKKKKKKVKSKNHQKKATKKRKRNLLKKGIKLIFIATLVTGSYLIYKYPESSMQKLKFLEDKASLYHLQYDCNKGNSNSCLDLSKKENNLEKFELYEKACTLNNPLGCEYIGNAHRNGDFELETNSTKALKFYEKACKLNASKSCAITAYMYQSSEGTNKNNHKALKYYKKSCRLNSAIGCNNLADIYYNGKIIKKNYKKAFGLYKKACSLKNALGCFKTAYAYKKGTGIPRNQSKASSYYIKSCELDYAGGCNNLGVMFEYGEGNLAKNSSKAIKYYHKACELNNHYGCRNLALMYEGGTGITKDLVIAKELFKKACGLGSERACDENL